MAPGRRIHLFYEDIRKLRPIELISDQIYDHIRTTHEVPNHLIAQRHYMATHVIDTLDKAYNHFIRLIEREPESESEPLLKYVQVKDKAFKKRLNKYILQDDVLTRMNDEQITR